MHAALRTLATALPPAGRRGLPPCGPAPCMQAQHAWAAAAALLGTQQNGTQHASSPCVQEYHYHLGPVNTITFIEDGKMFVSTSDDKTLRVWELGIPVQVRLTPPVATASGALGWCRCGGACMRLQQTGQQASITLSRKKLLSPCHPRIHPATVPPDAHSMHMHACLQERACMRRARLEMVSL